MISNERKKAMYKKALAALLATTTTLGLAGCGGNEETPKEDKVEEPSKNKEDDAGPSTSYLPTTEMSEEETKKLTTGITISADELTALPDERVLDDADLAVVYCYHGTEKSTDGVEIEYYPKMAQPINLSADGTSTTNMYDTTYFMEFMGIEIVNIEYFDINDKGQYEKFVKVDENMYESAGPVLSEEKLNELNGNQKTLK